MREAVYKRAGSAVKEEENKVYISTCIDLGGKAARIGARMSGEGKGEMWIEGKGEGRRWNVNTRGGDGRRGALGLRQRGTRST